MTTAPRHTDPRTPKKSGRVVLWIFLVLWIIAVTAIYVVIVQLKRGGEEGIRLRPPDAAPATPAPATPRPRDPLMNKQDAPAAGCRPRPGASCCIGDTSVALSLESLASAAGRRRKADESE